MTYLVTGGTGLIGSHIVRDLLKAGERVIVYDLSPDCSWLESELTKSEREWLKIVQGDVNDQPRLVQTVKEGGVRVIIHMASLLTDASEANPLLAVKVNCEGTINIFETARALSITRVVWASSVSVFGLPGRYIEEYIPNNAPHYPLGVYAACKSLNETVAAHYAKRFNLDIIGLRYSMVYGAGQTRGASGALMKELVLNPAVGKPGKVSNGDETIGWVYVEDASHATILAAKAPRPKTRVFSVMGELRSVKEIAGYVKQWLPDAVITLLPGDRGLRWKFETPIEREIGYRPQWTVERGIKEILDITRRQHGLPPV